MAVACRECEHTVVDNALFCEHCGAIQHPVLRTSTEVARTEPDAAPDPWFLHALRAVGVGLLLVVAWMTFILGLLWRMRILDVTGYRKRDLLWLWMPILGTVAEVRTVWRYTAREPYWEPRDDRDSRVLEGPARPVAIAAGWLALPALAAGAAVSWNADGDTQCVVEDVQDALDAEEFTFGNLGDAIDGALERCDIDVDFDGGPEAPEPPQAPDAP